MEKIGAAQLHHEIKNLNQLFQRSCGLEEASPPWSTHSTDHILYQETPKIIQMEKKQSVASFNKGSVKVFSNSMEIFQRMFSKKEKKETGKKRC